MGTKKGEKNFARPDKRRAINLAGDGLDFIDLLEMARSLLRNGLLLFPITPQNLIGNIAKQTG